MPTFIQIGHSKKNKGQLSSKAFIIKRSAKTIIRFWGAIELNGRNKKQLTWAPGYPAKKQLIFKSIKSAEEFKRVSILRRISNGYEKVNIKIFY